MAEKNQENTLYVQMFGNFSLTWNGKIITCKGKSSESQFASMMQLILHNRENGVSRDELEKTLFEGRELNDRHHALRTVIYNAKKKLRETGLPDVNYILQKDGFYYWNEQIPVVEDALEMERLCRLAEETKDLDEKLGIYLEACHLYKAEFISNQSGVVWIAQEAKKYRGLFCQCVEKAVELLRVNQDYMQMEELGIYASRISPLSDWEMITMEALVSLGRYEDARKLYDETVEFYMREQGLRPSPRLLEQMNRLGDQIEHRYALLDDIQMDLMRSGEVSGGYICSYPVFKGIYEMVWRMMERGGQSVYLMLCTIVDTKGNPMKDGPMLDELSQRLGDTIRHSVRQSDAIHHYSKGQYLVLLINTTRENCRIVQKRINYKFIVGRQRTGIQYFVNSIFCMPNNGRIMINGEEY